MAIITMFKNTSRLEIPCYWYFKVTAMGQEQDSMDGTKQLKHVREQLFLMLSGFVHYDLW